MKTERQRPLPSQHDDVLLAEEVLVVTRTRDPARMLLVRAMLSVTELVHRKESFEIRRLNQDVLARFDGENYSGRVEILTTLRPMLEYMEMFAQSIGAAVATKLSQSIRAQVLAELNQKSE